MPLLGELLDTRVTGDGRAARMIRTTRTVASQGLEPYGAPRRDAAADLSQGAFCRGDPLGLSLEVAFSSRRPADFLDRRLEVGFAMSACRRIGRALEKDEHLFSSLSVPGLDDQACDP